MINMAIINIELSSELKRKMNLFRYIKRNKLIQVAKRNEIEKHPMKILTKTISVDEKLGLYLSSFFKPMNVIVLFFS